MQSILTTPNDQDMLTELRILGSIIENDRITTNHATKPRVRIQKPSLFRSIYRFAHSESRVNNIIFIQSLLTLVIEKYNNAVLQKNKNLTKRIKTETLSAITGIEKLQRTYEDDLQFQACINVSIETIKLHLNLENHPSPQLPIRQVILDDNAPNGNLSDDASDCTGGESE